MDASNYSNDFASYAKKGEQDLEMEEREIFDSASILMKLHNVEEYMDSTAGNSGESPISTPKSTYEQIITNDEHEQEPEPQEPPESQEQEQEQEDSIEEYDEHPHSPTSKRKRQRTSPHQLDLLEKIFIHDKMPNQKTRNELALQLGMSSRRIQVWFQNKRAKLKRGPSSPISDITQTMTSPIPNFTTTVSIDENSITTKPKVNKTSIKSIVDEESPGNSFPSAGSQMFNLTIPASSTQQSQTYIQPQHNNSISNSFSNFQFVYPYNYHQSDSTSSHSNSAFSSVSSLSTPSSSISTLYQSPLKEFSHNQTVKDQHPISIHHYESNSYPAKAVNSLFANPPSTTTYI